MKSARKAHKACERVSETREQEQNRMRMASMSIDCALRDRDSVQFLINTQVQSHALLRRGFGTSVPFIFHISFYLQSYINVLRDNGYPQVYK